MFLNIIQIIYLIFFILIVYYALENKRWQLLYPAQTFLLSALISYSLISWWPLVYGYVIVTIMENCGLGITTEKFAKKLVPGNFIENNILFIIVGMIGYKMFQFNLHSILNALLIVFSIHSLNSVGSLLFTNKKLKLIEIGSSVDEDPQIYKHMRGTIIYSLPEGFVWYSIISLTTAYIIRLF